MAKAIQEGQPRLRQATEVTGAGILVMALITACGAPKATEQPTPQPTPKPTELVTPMPTPSQTEVIPTPTGSAIVTFPPTFSPRPTGTPVEVTPTPEATPIPISNLVDQIVADAEANGWPTVSKKAITDSISNAYDNDPQAAVIINPTQNNILERDFVNEVQGLCFSGDHMSCAPLINEIYWEGYRIDENNVWMPAISSVVNYAHANMNSHDFGVFLGLIDTFQAPPF